MTLINRVASSLALTVALTASIGCSNHNFALVGRDTLPPHSSQPIRSEMGGTVVRIDTASNEIHLRASAGHPDVVTFSAETRVNYLGRVYPVSQLRFGDIVAMQMEQDSRENPHTHSIRLEKSNGDWAQRQN